MAAVAKRRLMKRACLLTLALVAILEVGVGAQQNPAVVSLNSPKCVRVPEARGETAADEELGIGRSGEYCAYPLRMMAYHRIVNDHLGGPPILVSYDPDSGAGRVFDPVLDGKSYTFDAAPPQRGLPMLTDRETRSLWSALSGEALSGPLAGKRMTLIPSLILTWERWKELHPDSWVLAEDVRLSPHYTVRATPASCPIPAAVSHDLLRRPDSRLKADTLVLGLTAAGETAAFPLTDKRGRSLRQPQVIEQTLGDQRLVLFSDPSARAAATYRPVVKDRPLTFTVSGDGGTPRWSDRQTGSLWTIEGRCVAGPLKGESLSPLEFVRVRWYAWSALHPRSGIFRSRSGLAGSGR